MEWRRQRTTRGGSDHAGYPNPATKRHIGRKRERVVSDAACWEPHLNRIGAKVADPEMRERLTGAVRTMMGHLGEDWPSKTKDDNLLRWFLGNVSGAVSDYLLVIWGDAISAVEGAAGFERMIAKLRDPGRLESPISELEMAGRLAGRGCHIEFEPEVGGKRPDLLCQSSGSEFFVEVKTLGTAPRDAQATQTLVDVLAACRPISPAGRIFRILPRRDLEKVADILKRKAYRAVSGNAPVEVCLPKVLKVYLVPDELPDRARMIDEWIREQERTWMMSRGGGWMYGPPYHTSPERRVRARINKLAREGQIPPDKIGVLAVKGQFLFADADAAKRPVGYIAEALRRTRNVPAVVLVSDKMFGGSEESTITDRRGFTFIRNRLHEMICEDVVIIKNPFFESEFDYQGLKRLLAA